MHERTSPLEAVSQLLFVGIGVALIYGVTSVMHHHHEGSHGHDHGHEHHQHVLETPAAHALEHDHVHSH
jgi:zinc and cadmium transporter